MVKEDGDLEVIKKELAAEIATIKAGNSARESLVRELAVTRLLLRYAESKDAYQSEALAALQQSLQIANDGVTLWEAERQRNEILKQQQNKLINFLPNIYEAGKKSFSKRGAEASHKENRAIKQEVFEWLDENFPTQKSMDAAAEAIARKIAPVAVRTARDWVGQWKKLRSASTP